MSTIDFLKDFLLTIPSLVAAIAAWVALGTWKRQLQANKDYDQAKDTLCDLLFYKSAVYRFRDPTTADVSELTDEQRDRIRANPSNPIPWNRLTAETRFLKMKEAMSRLEASLMAAEAIWGIERKPLLDEFERIEKWLIECVNAEINRQFWDSPTFPAIVTGTYDSYYGEKHGDCYVATQADGAKDVFGDVFDEAIERVERKVRPRLNGSCL